MANRVTGVNMVVNPRTMLPLSFDVLATILVFSESREVSRFMQTCRILCHEGAKVLARRGTWLDSLQRISSFLRFMEAEGRSRCQYLSDLCIVMPYPYHALIHEVEHALAGLLRAGSFRSLTRLYLDSADLIFAHTPELIPAFAIIPSFQHITLEGCGPPAAKFLQVTKSKPTFVELIYDGISNEDPSARNESHPIVALQNVRASLQRLCVTEFASPLDRNLSLEPLVNLDTLVLDRTERPVLGPYIRYCPNLRHLKITTFYNYESTVDEDGNDIMDSDRLDKLRSINVAYQR
ncbi:hypothetical protein K466DRAFT_661407 [Polyporus arcularius HHB13444]|uniref:F-box domain-containing protein n=1 Tax=Polyporus arcularius HHB13444 TaxID=1314778 RepID=A0A5C3PMT7_9APHY|nr:hypothetical protein K466DRAFT_661407 [Polyporus arcularius HHB13444]